MVSTRHHPKPFPEPASPTTTTRSSATSSPAPPSPTSPTANGSATTVAKARPSRKRKSTMPTPGTYTHVIDNVTILWLFVSLILVAWDTGYIFMRPYSMPGGYAHSPIWIPYALYGTVDYIYGWPAWNDGVGFTAAQGALNIVESSMYGYYLFELFRCGKGTEWFKVWDASWWTRKTAVQSDAMALAIITCFAGAVMTVSKTVLYWLNEYFSSYANVGHNDWSRLVFLWVIPNGAWLVVPSWMIYVFGKEILGAMKLAGRAPSEKEE